MRVLFRNSRLQALCEDDKERRKKWGEPAARKVVQRILELEAAPTLQAAMRVPSLRCHPLKGELKGLFAVKVHEALRLIFRPSGEPGTITPREGLDPGKVTDIEIVRIEDYHD